MQDYCFARKVLVEDFLYERHVNYLLKTLKRSTFGGTPMEVAEAHRLSSLFFVVSGLDLLGALDTRLSPADKQDIIQWIYSYQVDIDHILLPLDLFTFNGKSSPSASPSPPPSPPEVHNANRAGGDGYNDNADDGVADADDDDDHTKNTSNITPTHNNINNISRNNMNRNSNNNNNKTHNSNSNNKSSNNNHDQDHDNHRQHHQNPNQNHNQNHRRPASPNGADNIIIRTTKLSHAGFRASAMIDSEIPFDCGTLTMTYCALATLVILGDDLARVDRESIIRGMRQLQLPNGSFKSSALGGESDMRLVYCAAAVSCLLNDWSGMDVDKCAKFIRSSMSYEGAFAQYPGSEAHGGSTFCALASLKLMSKLDECLDQGDQERLIRWCINRLDQGFSGRPNKDQDTCYSFWIGACLVILNHFEYVEQKNLLDFILMAQEERGGLSKVPDFYSDPLHTYLGFAGLTFIDEELCSKRGISLLKLDPTLNISQRARSFLDKIHLTFT